MSTLDELQSATFARATPATAGSFSTDRTLTGSVLTGYLDRRAFAVVASTRPDGRPHAAMTSYVRRDTTIWLPTVTDAIRARNVAAQPWLTMLVTEGDHDAHVMVSVEGPAVVLDPADVPDDVRSSIEGDWVGCWIRLDVTRVMSYASEGALPSGP